MAETLLSLDPSMALTVIAGRGCESFTTGIGSCLKNGRHLISLTGTADQACSPCVAWAALPLVSQSAADRNGQRTSQSDGPDQQVGQA